MPIINDLIHTAVSGGGAVETIVKDIDNATGHIGFGTINRNYETVNVSMGSVYTTLWNELSGMVDMILGIKIGDYCNFNDRMYGYMSRLMLINLSEKNTTLSMLCDIQTNQAIGNSDIIGKGIVPPSYTKGNNYLETARSLKANEKIGIDATNVVWRDGDTQYGNNLNLFPDDNDQWAINKETDSGIWETYDPNSILYKTKCLFRQRKINTLISRFGTNADPNPDPDKVTNPSTASTYLYGLSHGRNLLKKHAEDGTMTYEVNGYNNPYCRVWTHHYQYDKLSKVMRPFVEETYTTDENGNTNKTLRYRDLKKVHNWGDGFQADTVKQYVFEENSGGMGPANMTEKTIEKPSWKSNARWEKSVLYGRGDGLVNITPHFDGGGAKNIHTKDCMFSIENLAWKDYDPYSFETALSWEQRGPLGGRIMWFPPYGLSFTETTQAQWNANQFIGRGEDVYTYVNTKRSGTLSFYLIVDHPSVLDYVTWYGANRDKIKDTDILRYFAGCDPADPNNPDSLLHYTKPMPLTDEGERVKKSGEKRKAKEVEKKEDKPANKEERVEFGVFFPNNYSGAFDVKDSKLGVDFVIKYLLAGKDVQGVTKFGDETNKKNPSLETEVFTKMEGGNGYEINDTPNKGISQSTDNKNVIYGNKVHWSGKTTEYSPDSTKLWRYRIDGNYTVPTKNTPSAQDINSTVSNTYDQVLEKNDYKDSASFQLNSRLKNQTDFYKKDIPKTAYAFTEVIYALLTTVKENTQGDKADIEMLWNFFKDNKTTLIDSNREEAVSHLIDLFSSTFKKNENEPSLKLKEISATGYSNSHGNKEKNDFLAEERGNTIAEWIKSINKTWQDVEKKGKGVSSVEVKGKNVNTLEAKIWRSAKCVLTFSLEQTVDATESEMEPSEDFEGYVKTGEKFGSTGKDVYRLAHEKGKEDGTQKWVKLDNGELMEITNWGDEVYKDSADEALGLALMEGRAATEEEILKNMEKDTLFNKVRYDKEYYFFKKLEADKPIIFKKLMDKLQYFDPAFHSMTPEGFNARLTFLNQCTRQGNTVGVSDKNRLSASNMAFGRPPFCVLRVGDFYNQMIVIHSINIDYDVSNGITWDLNDEGVGVQPMLAKVSMNFDFIGGSDLGGALRKLQNAMSFGYYANTELYDNRADRIDYVYDIDLAMGGAERGTIDKENSTFPNVGMYDPYKMDDGTIL